ncbi:hypothetical protein [Solibacillus sp. NPDC093137]|uniref:hypothetical protein n=1 Tax=Solibacillus sp. NPDC093137 TaxID=3390678 RepID=UPI003CFDA6D2
MQILKTLENTYDSAINLKKAFAEIDEKKWTSNVFCQEIMLQLSHLQSVYYTEEMQFILEDNRSLTNLNDEISDLYLQILNLANIYFSYPELEKEIIELYESTPSNMLSSQYIVALSIILGQINESVMILTKYRFKLNRSTLYGAEETDYLKQKISEFIIILFHLAEGLKIDINDSFFIMFNDASNFLKEI